MKKVTSQVITVFFWIITQRVVVIPYQRFGTIYRSHLRESRSIGCPETSVRNDHSPPCNNPEERNSHLLCDRSRKSSSQMLNVFEWHKKFSEGREDVEDK